MKALFAFGAILLAHCGAQVPETQPAEISTKCVDYSNAAQAIFAGISSITAQLTNVSTKLDGVADQKVTAQSLCQGELSHVKGVLADTTAALNQMKSEMKALVVDRSVQYNKLDALERRVVELEGSSIARPRNIKQFAWRDSGNGVQTGIIKTVSFQKHRNASALWIQYDGNLRVHIARSVQQGCSRWFFTVDGQECKDPAPVDAVYYVHASPLEGVHNVHNPSAFGGLCMGIPGEVVDVSLNVGQCLSGYPLGDALTGWVSTSRIIIEEIDM